MELMKKGNTREVSTTTANAGARIKITCGQFRECTKVSIEL